MNPSVPKENVYETEQFTSKRKRNGTGIITIDPSSACSSKQSISDLSDNKQNHPHTQQLVNSVFNVGIYDKNPLFNINIGHEL